MSWLDDHIAMDQLIKEQRETYWDSLVAATATVCNKLRAAYGKQYDCKYHVNDHNSRITVTRRREEPGEGSAEFENNLQVRFDRQQNQLVVSAEPLLSLPVIFRATTDEGRTVLLFTDGVTPREPLELAEMAICQKFLQMPAPGNRS